jgi:hypothetical protein
MATVYWNTAVGFDKGLAGEERHGIAMDWDTHHYLHETVGSRFESGLTGTFDDTTITIEAGVWHDEDIEHAPTQQTTCNVLYKNGSAAWEWDAGASVYYKLNGTALRYNNGNDLADCTPNRYMAMWIFATNDISEPIVALMGQRQDTTLANARANNTYESLSFGELPFEEMKILYRVILRSTGSPPTFVETQDLRAVSNLPGGTFVATDHGTLTNLDQDTHLQYALLVGRTGGQVLSGSDTTAEDLTLQDNTVDNNTLTVTQGIAAYTHISNDGSDHSFIDQDVTSGASVTFGTVSIDSRIVPTGDGNTWIEFSADNIQIEIGGWDLGRFNTSGAIFNNEGIASLDFRVESDSNEYMLFVDSGNNKVGIGKVDPASTLDVNGSLTVADNIVHSGDTNNYIAFTTDVIDFYSGGGADLIRLDASGVWLNAQQDAFRTLISGDSEMNLLYVDAANDRVGIGTSSPDNLLDVHGTAEVNALVISGSPAVISSDNTIQLKPSGDNDDYLEFYTSANIPIIKVIGGNIFHVESDHGSSVTFKLQGTGSNYIGLSHEKTTNEGIIRSTGNLYIKTNDDGTDYISLTTVSDVPTIGTVGSCDLKITASSGAIDFDDENLTTTGYIATHTNAVTAGAKFSHKTAAIAPLTKGVYELVSEPANTIPAGLTSGFLSLSCFEADDATAGGFGLAGSFINNTAGTLTADAAQQRGLFGGCNTAIINDGSYNIGLAMGLQFTCSNEEDFVGKGSKGAYSLFTYGAHASSTLGWTGKTISLNADIQNYGGYLKGAMDGTYNSTVGGLNYGLCVDTVDGVDGGSGDIISYGIYINAATSNADFGSGGTLTSWGLYEANGVDNALAGNTRIGGTTAPSYACDVTGDVNCSGSYRTGGVAGVSGSFTSVTVVNGIVIGGS